MLQLRGCLILFLLYTQTRSYVGSFCSLQACFQHTIIRPKQNNKVSGRKSLLKCITALIHIEKSVIMPNGCKLSASVGAGRLIWVMNSSAFPQLYSDKQSRACQNKSRHLHPNPEGLSCAHSPKSTNRSDFARLPSLDLQVSAGLSRILRVRYQVLLDARQRRKGKSSSQHSLCHYLCCLPSAGNLCKANSHLPGVNIVTF